MEHKIASALISVFYKDGLAPIVEELHKLGITIYSTGGTQQFIEQLGIPCIGVETITNYPSILGGRVKTLHPKVFGGILGRRNEAQDLTEMKEYAIPEIDLVIVDLYPFEATLAEHKEAIANGASDAPVIEKIDIGGPSMIRAAAKNHLHTTVVASKQDYTLLHNILVTQKGITNYEQRRHFAALAFKVVKDYDIAIADYFLKETETPLRYGENPHQQAQFKGNLNELFIQLHGKELSYNNLVDVDAALQLLHDIQQLPQPTPASFFGIIKHNNVCGAAMQATVHQAWQVALSGDPESAFGGILVSNTTINKATAEAISEIFFEVLIAPSFDEDALNLLKAKKNRILLQLKKLPVYNNQVRSLLNGTLSQQFDEGNTIEWNEVGGANSSESEKQQMLFANLLAKHLKSNSIALVHNYALIGKGCGQTSRIDSLRQAIEKAKQFNQPLKGAILASDAFFPFDDCIKMAHQNGITIFIQPGGSIRDQDSVAYAKENNLVLVLTAMRHFKH
jgi:phosphoribosylaminoimidazolecarboxamide formyltransferase / IMP cyclohydrolase